MKIKLFFITLIVISTLPLIGNKVIEEYLSNSLLVLKTHGLSLTKEYSKSTYLSTKKHYEFIVKDEKEFLLYIKKYSNKKLPSYHDISVEGLLIGVDVEYSNILFSKSAVIEIYPLKLPNKISNNLKNDNKELYDYLNKLFHSKSFLYHINYNVTSKDFSGYIKDINEKYSFVDAKRLHFELNKALFHGRGDLISSSLLYLTVNKINFSMKDSDSKILLQLSHFTTKSSFDATSTHLSSNLDTILLNTIEKDENVSIVSHDIKIDVSSNFKATKVEFKTKIYLGSIKIKSLVENLFIEELQYDVDVADLDKDSFEKFKLLDTYPNVTQIQQQEMIDIVMKMLSKGLNIKRAGFSVKGMSLDSKKLNGFNIETAIKIKEDKNFSSKIKISPLLLIQDLNINVDINLSNEIYTKLMKGVPMTGVMKSYAIKDNKSVFYNISYVNGLLKVNGKSLK